MILWKMKDHFIQSFFLEGTYLLNRNMKYYYTMTPQKWIFNTNENWLWVNINIQMMLMIPKGI